MTTLIIVRHGQSVANLTRCFAGQTNPDLTATGMAQANLLALWLTQNYKIDKIYASDLIRAYHTAKPTADILNLPVITSNRLREINGGYWQGVSYADISEKYRDDYSLWLHDIGRAKCTGGESVLELSARVVEEVQRIAEDNSGKTILIVTHATPIRALQSYYEKGSVDSMRDVDWVPNTSSTICCYEDGKMHFNLVGYDNYLNNFKSEFPAGLV